MSSFSIESIKQSIISAFGEKAEIVVKDESFKHATHIQSKDCCISHVSVKICWEGFEGLSLLNKQRLVNDCLKEFFEKGLHSVEYKNLSAKGC